MAGLQGYGRWYYRREDKRLSREEYLNQLHKYLRKLPRQDYEDAMEYFTEYFQETDE